MPRLSDGSRQVVLPEYDPNFAALGAAALASGERTATLILSAHAVLAGAASALLLALVTPAMTRISDGSYQ